jgi:hypothetical protein
MKQSFLTASRNPLDDINQIAYQGQPVERRMYHEGYERFFEAMPVLKDGDEFLSEKIQMSKTVMRHMAENLKQDSWAHGLQPIMGGFNRTILGIESPTVKADGGLKEGSEIVLARWGDGHTSPVHGHAAGYLHEELLFGKIRVNTYRIVDAKKRIVRPLRTEIFDKPGTIASKYGNQSESTERNSLVHNFTSIGYSGTLHYLPEHTRDGRDNGFTVEYFEDRFGINQFEVTQLTAQQGLELKIGDVALVRSQNVPEYGDHYIIITGRPVLKQHGLRPMDVAIHAPTIDATNSKTFSALTLDKFEPIMGLTLLKLNEVHADRFRRFHGITATENSVTFS